MGGLRLLRLKQASTGMSSLRRLVGKGLGSIAVEAVLIGMPIVPPPIDSSLHPAAHRFPSLPHASAGMTCAAGLRHGKLVLTSL